MNCSDIAFPYNGIPVPYFNLFSIPSLNSRETFDIKPLGYKHNYYEADISISEINEENIPKINLQKIPFSNIYIDKYTLPKPINYELSNLGDVNISIPRLLNIDDIKTNEFNYNFDYISGSYIKPSFYDLIIEKVIMSNLRNYVLKDIAIPKLDYKLPNLFLDITFDVEVPYFGLNTSFKNTHYFNAIGFKHKIDLSLNSFDNFIQRKNEFLFLIINEIVNKEKFSIQNSISYLTMLNNFKSFVETYSNEYINLLSDVSNLKVNNILLDFSLWKSILDKNLVLETLNSYADTINKLLSLYHNYKSALQSYIQGVVQDVDINTTINIINNKFNLLNSKLAILKFENDFIKELKNIQDAFYNVNNTVIPQIISVKQDVLDKISLIVSERFNLLNAKSLYIFKVYNNLVNKANLSSLRYNIYNKLIQVLEISLLEDVYNYHNKLFLLEKERIDTIFSNLSIVNRLTSLKYELDNMNIFYRNNIKLYEVMRKISDDIYVYYNSVYNSSINMYEYFTELYDGLAKIYACADVTVEISRVIK